MRERIKLFNLEVKPGEKQVSVYFRKQDGPENKDGSTGVILRCKGGEKAVTKFIDVLNQKVLGGSDANSK